MYDFDLSFHKRTSSNKLKTPVLDSISSPITKRVYNLGLNEFLACYKLESRAGFTPTTGGWRPCQRDNARERAGSQGMRLGN